MPLKRAAISPLLVYVATVVIIIVSVASLSFFAFRPSIRPSSQTGCTLGSFPTAPNYPPCAAPLLSYESFQQYVSESTSIEHVNRGIILTVGYHPCTVWWYTLPNDTDVMVYLGTLNATQTCG
jgi:hypothetical protein